MSKKWIKRTFGLVVIISFALLVNKSSFAAGGRSVPYYSLTANGGTWKNSLYRLKDGTVAKDCFFFDGSYTYYLQADGTPMKDRLTYHPNGKDIIYFDTNGHEVFNAFQYCPSVGYTCYFDSNGYIYKDKITFSANSTYYLDGNGKLQNSGWFQFANGRDYGYANSNGSLMNGGWSYDPWGRVVFFHWNGMVARGLITDNIWYYSMDETDGHYLGQFSVEENAINNIRNFYQSHPFTFNSPAYDEQPSAAAPFKAGTIKQQSLEEALNAVNLMRYIAGLPADITLKMEYNTYAQHAALVNAALGKALSHYPSKPEGMSHEMYSVGLEGAQASNLSAGYNSIAAGIQGCMDDSDKSNVSKVGHRRWILNPSMQTAGFGFVKNETSSYRNYSAMYAHDMSRSGQVEFTYIAWPGVYMPQELMDNDVPWSVTLGESYATPDYFTKITLQRINDGKTWYFSIDDMDYGSVEDKFYNVNTGAYGVSNCIIFRPKLSEIGGYKAGDRYQVTVSGIYLSDGTPTTLRYQVCFFELGLR